ncbi:ATPase [Trypanosoma cruzi]|uniref:ATPase n=1 Tax=Trypanosoma cruzi TaxID=5693 RepID=A0A7J6XQS1_TRYCR|nr:ATPase [Trypanosoma cruzi]
MHTHACPLVLSFAPHAPLPSCLAAWAEHRNCFCFVSIALSGRPLSLSVCVFCFTGAMRVCARWSSHASAFCCFVNLIFFSACISILFSNSFCVFFSSHSKHPSFLLLLWGAINMDVSFLFYSSLFNCFFCTLPVRGAVCFPPNCSTRTPTDTLMTTALCASPAARMRRGRDERRAEGAVTCGRATRACGAEHTFLSLLFCFYCGQGGQTPAAPHTQPHAAAVFFFFSFFCGWCVLPPCVIVEVVAVPHASLPSSCASC